MLKPSELTTIPPETVHVAKAAFPKGNLYLKIRDEFGDVFSDDDFANLFPKRGQPALAPWRLALVSVVQFLENLSDRQAAEAVRARIDVKYLLGLDLTDPGFDFSVLSEFRQRLVEGQAEQVLLDKLLKHFKAKGLVKAGGKQRTDSTHVLAAIRVLNRLELIGETLRAALNELAQEAPDWLRSVSQSEWFERYGKRIEEYRFPKGKEAREKLAFQMAEDGFVLLAALAHQQTPTRLREVPMVNTLRLVWERHFAREERGDDQGHKVRWRDAKELFESPIRLETPYDTEAKFSQKGNRQWVGYKVHLTESCDDDQVHVITDVHTTEAVKQDVACTDLIQQSLVAKGLPPREHLVDSGYVDAELLCKSEDKGITLIGPPRKDKSWQAKIEGAYDHSYFQIDWEKQQVTCPNGKQSRSWTTRHRRAGQPCVWVYFHEKDCRTCSVKQLCTKDRQRALMLHLQDQHQALHTARTFLDSDAGQAAYQKRAGIEGTLSQGIRLCDLRVTRYRGLRKTSLQQVATAVGINFSRVFAWFEDFPRAKTRTSHFAGLVA
jgi:transposase